MFRASVLYNVLLFYLAVLIIYPYVLRSSSLIILSIRIIHDKLLTTTIMIIRLQVSKLY